MRSLLFVPGDSEKKLAKGFGSEADVVIVDLEDFRRAGQQGCGARDRGQLHRGAKTADTRAKVYVRVNDLSTGLTDDDLTAIVKAAPDGIMLPKSNSGADVQHLAAKLRVHEAEAGLPDGGIAILPLITETAAGVLAAGTYAGAQSRGLPG